MNLFIVPPHNRHYGKISEPIVNPFFRRFKENFSGSTIISSPGAFLPSIGLFRAQGTQVKTKKSQLTRIFAPQAPKICKNQCNLRAGILAVLGLLK
jgi:hypothetical protein